MRLRTRNPGRSPSILCQPSEHGSWVHGDIVLCHICLSCWLIRRFFFGLKREKKAPARIDVTVSLIAHSSKTSVLHYVAMADLYHRRYGMLIPKGPRRPNVFHQRRRLRSTQHLYMCSSSSLCQPRDQNYRDEAQWKDAKRILWKKAHKSCRSWGAYTALLSGRCLPPPRWNVWQRYDSSNIDIGACERV